MKVEWVALPHILPWHICGIFRYFKIFLKINSLLHTAYEKNVQKNSYFWVYLLKLTVIIFVFVTQSLGLSWGKMLYSNINPENMLIYFARKEGCVVAKFGSSQWKMPTFHFESWNFRDQEWLSLFRLVAAATATTTTTTTAISIQSAFELMKERNSQVVTLFVTNTMLLSIACI